MFATIPGIDWGGGGGCLEVLEPGKNGRHSIKWCQTTETV